MNNLKLKLLLGNYNKKQLYFIKDFLISEIDDDNVEETIQFVLSNDSQKKDFFRDMLYSEKLYGLYLLEGNQYLLGSTIDSVKLIDLVGMEHGKKEVIIDLSLEDFVFLIKNEREALVLLG